MKGKLCLFALILSSCCFFTSKGEPVLLDFEGIVDISMEPSIFPPYISEYYNGGMASPSYNNATGPDYGITFINGLALNNATEGEPSPPTIAFFSLSYFGEGPQYVVNVEGGFTSLSFYYTRPFESDAVGMFSNISIWSGFNGTGELLAFIPLPGNTNTTENPCNNTYNQYCNFSQIIVPYFGVARSINFINATYGDVGFDDMYFDLGGNELANVSILAIDGGYPNILYTLSPTDPSFAVSSNRVSGLSLPGEQLLAIAQQRSTGLVWGISNKNRLYQLDPFTADAYYINTIGCNIIYDNPTLHASFDPDSGLLYIVTLVTRNNVDLFVIDTSSGDCVNMDAITFPGEVPIYPAGAAFEVESSTFYLVNSLPSNQLGTVDLSSGQFTPIGSLGLDISGVGGFDIIPGQPNYGFAALYENEELKSALYRIDLSTGQATRIASLNFTTNLLSFAAVQSTTVSPNRIYKAYNFPPIPIVPDTSSEEEGTVSRPNLSDQQSSQSPETSIVFQQSNDSEGRATNNGKVSSAHALVQNIGLIICFMLFLS